MFRQDVLGTKTKLCRIECLPSEKLYQLSKTTFRTWGLIVNGYIPLMRDPKSEIKIPKDLRDGKEKLIFCNIEQIYKWHKEWVQTLVFSLVNNLCNLYLCNKSMIHHCSPRHTLDIFLNISTKAERILRLYRLPHFKIKLSCIITVLRQGFSRSI